MRGFGAIEKGKTGWLEKPDLAIKNPDEVLIKTTAVAMCTSDVHMVEAGNFPSIFGNIIGHEAVGVVVEVGADVKDFKVGDRVAIPDTSPVWGNLMAQNGLPQYAPGGRTVDPNLDGMFSEYILFQRADAGLVHIPDNVTDIQALMAVDMVATPQQAIDFLDIQHGETCAVIGIGPCGLCGAELCAVNGAGKIIGVGHRQACKDVAPEMGVNVVLDYHDGNVADLVLAANDGKPVDKVMIATYYPGVLTDAFRMCRVGGKICNFGMFLGFENLQTSVSGDKEFKYVRCATGRYYLEGIMQQISYGRIHPEKVVSHVYHGFDSIPEAFAKMSNKTDDLIKTISVF